MLHDGHSSSDQVEWKVKVQIGGNTIEEIPFSDEQKAYKCYLSSLNSPIMPERVVLLHRNGTLWEVLAENGVWCTTWRPNK